MAGMPGPGDRIEARCTRCNDITGHVIVALVGGEIVKVECRACGSVHKYYPPATPKEVKGKTAVCRVKAGETRKEAVNSFKPTSTPSTAAASPAAASRAAAKAQKAAEDMEQNWQRTMNMTVASARPYAMNESFAVGDVVEHPKFGSGVVQEVFPPTRCRSFSATAPRCCAVRVRKGRDFENGEGRLWEKGNALCSHPSLPLAFSPWLRQRMP